MCNRNSCTLTPFNCCLGYFTKRKESLSDLRSTHGVKSKGNQQEKLQIFHGKKRREITWMVKVAKSGHQVTWTQKTWEKRKD